MGTCNRGRATGGLDPRITHTLASIPVLGPPISFGDVDIAGGFSCKCAPWFCVSGCFLGRGGQLCVRAAVPFARACQLQGRWHANGGPGRPAENRRGPRAARSLAPAAMEGSRATPGQCKSAIQVPPLALCMQPTQMGLLKRHQRTAFLTALRTPRFYLNCMRHSGPPFAAISIKTSVRVLTCRSRCQIPWPWGLRDI